VNSGVTAKPPDTISVGAEGCRSRTGLDRGASQP
jgi:hypothetical protein